MSNRALEVILEPLSRHYEDPNVIELLAKHPGQITLEVRNNPARFVNIIEPDLDLRQITLICRALANYSGLEFNPVTAPRVSTIIPPLGHRFECLLGNSVRTGLSLAIRCKHPHDISLEAMGLDQSHIDYLKDALDQQWNIAISGSTNTGKTTLLNKLLTFLPDERRVVSAEDTPELDVDRFANGVSLMAARDTAQGGNMLSWSQLYDHKTRISPENILFGEISTQNAFAALNVLNMGARGWMCTVHAESAKLVPARFQSNIDASGQILPDAAGFMRELVDLVVHIRRTPAGTRFVSEIYEMKNDHYVLRRLTPDSTNLAA